jgi:hypothetical protein
LCGAISQATDVGLRFPDFTFSLNFRWNFRRKSKSTTDMVKGIIMTAKNAVTKVPFYGNELITVEKDGKIYIAMKSIVEGMGLAWQVQARKITSTERYNHMVIPFETAGGKQDMIFIPLNKINGWLFSINAEKCRADIREKVKTYQEECFRVLHDYFHNGGAINPLANEKRIVELFEKAISKINRRDEIIQRQQKIIDLVTSDSVYGEFSEVTGKRKLVLVRQHFRSYIPPKKKKSRNPMQMVFDLFKGDK